MNITHYVGWDNGVSSNGIAVLGPNDLVKYEKLPIKKEQSYTKEIHMISRVDVPALRVLLKSLELPSDETEVLMERAMVNPRRFRASLSAIRALEACLIVIEEFGYYLRYVDSKEWQSVLLPGVEGSDELKAASLKLGQKLYPKLKFKSDADSILIAHWAKYNNRSTKKKEL